MPTQSDNTPQLTASALPEEISTHNTCPPEIDRELSWTDVPEGRTSDDDDLDGSASPASTAMLTAGRRSSDATDATSVVMETIGSMKKVKSDEDVILDSMSPASASSDGREEQSNPTIQTSSSSVASPSTSSTLNSKFSNIRLYPNYTSSYFRPGSKFTGTQQSDRQIYNVDVEFKHVDMADSFLCGFLRIQGLTEDHPTLTTYFEGEIIGTKHTFLTKHEEWGTTAVIDMGHWFKFPAWRPLSKQAKGQPDFTYRNFAQRDHIFMRWKEYFLVPDHRVRSISGASFEGFYYICFNQAEGTVSGIYYHSKSDNSRYQQLELKHVEDRGCTPAIEFR